MPLIIYPLAVPLLVSTGLVFRTGAGSPSIEAAWSLVLCALTFVLVATAMYLTGNMVGSDHIEGIQPRYLLPAITLLAVALSARPSSRSVPSLVPQIAIFATACCLVVFSQFWIALRFGLFA
jgi:uncharacterized membrane protein